MTDTARHWDDAYARGEGNLSWYESVPTSSLRMLDAAGIDVSAAVVDVGGGTSRLVDELVARGHVRMTVLDVSSVAIEHAQRRLCERAERVEWVVADIRTWQPEHRYQVWHDRAVFHFLTDPADRAAYRDTLHRATAPGSVVVIATFASDGPAQCSGLVVARYDPTGISAALGPDWELVDSMHEEHRTPRGVTQPFTWAILRRMRPERNR